jgi:hypothetical protein
VAACVVHDAALDAGCDDDDFHDDYGMLDDDYSNLGLCVDLAVTRHPEGHLSDLGSCVDLSANRYLERNAAQSYVTSAAAVAVYEGAIDAVDVVHDAALDAQKTATYHSLRAGMLKFDVPLVFHMVESIRVMPDSLNFILKMKSSNI